MVSAVSLGGSRAQLDAWARVQLARHAERPHTLDYISDLCTDFIELHGDRAFRDDPAIVGGVARLLGTGRTVIVIGHQKGANTKENLRRHFGMAHPEGFRKAKRLMRHAEKFRLPVLTFLDIPGADPGIGSEERGQALAVAECIQTLAELRVPIVATVIGEGGSGGALALGVADHMIMLENATYSVITPEGCAAILWNDAKQAPAAAAAMRVTADNALSLGIIDEIIPEPIPAHEDPHGATAAVGRAIRDALDRLEDQFPLGEPGSTEALLAARYDKFRAIGRWRDEATAVLNDA
jgi:acetyl-CoA carboxylase carboxyl transferase subunit alpha